MNKFCAAIFCVMGLVMCQQSLSSTYSTNNKQLLYQRLNTINTDIVRMAKRLGKPKIEKLILEAEYASSRESYFQARTMYTKANRLAYEITGSFKRLPELDENLPVETRSVLLADATIKRINIVLKRLKLSVDENVVDIPDGVSSTELFNLMQKVNQELNDLMYKPVAPGDVYEEVTLAVNYLSNVLLKLDDNFAAPTSTPDIFDKTPRDVYGLLVKCQNIFQKISEKKEKQTLNIKINKAALYQINPSDVYDLATLLSSEAEFLNNVYNESTTKNIDSYYAGYKTPSEVYQRVMILMEQLEVIENILNKK